MLRDRYVGLPTLPATFFLPTSTAVSSISNGASKLPLRNKMAAELCPGQRLRCQRIGAIILVGFAADETNYRFVVKVPPKCFPP